MTNTNLTHLYFLLDRSGSMNSIVEDTVGGFDAFIAEQRETPGECRVTLAQFDDAYEEVYADSPAAPRHCSTRWPGSSSTPASGSPPCPRTSAPAR
jgi:hypothetical protein